MNASNRAARLCAALCGLVVLATPAVAQRTPPAPAPWYGLPLPPGVSETPAVIVGERDPRPVHLPTGEPAAPELSGAAMRKDLATIVAFSAESRQQREVGSGQLWGRISGFPSGAKTVAWAVAQFRAAGISNVALQNFKQEAAARFWLPLEWEVRLIADPAFGPGSADVVLASAMPLGPSEIAGGTMSLPLVYVGNANAAVLEHIDVKGKIAVQLVIPQGHTVLERGPANARIQSLVKRGAAAVLNIVKLPGNEHSRDFGNCGAPCFNLGGRDGHFLESVFERAALAGHLDKLRAQLTLKTETRSNLSAVNGVAIVPGRRDDEAIIVNAHADAWFEGAGDNGDGLAVLIALARHFARPENQPERTLAFVASAGHHSTGMNGPRNFVAMNPEIAKKAVLMLNIEHVAQRNFSAARTVAADGYREAITDVGEAPIVAGVSNGAPFIDDLFKQGVARYGVNFISGRSTMESGETGGYSSLDIARITIMQAPPLYHTTGEVLDVISTPGLERIARFFAFFIKEAGKAARSQIIP